MLEETNIIANLKRASKLFLSPDRNSIEAIELNKWLLKQNPVGILENIFQFSEFFHVSFLITHQNFWQNLSLSEWLQILKKYQNNQGDLYYALQFMYKFLEIDSILLIYVNYLFCSEITQKIIEFYIKFPGNLLLNHFFVKEVLSGGSYNLTYITQKLKLEGAKPSQKNKEDIVFTLLSLFNTGHP